MATRSMEPCIASMSAANAPSSPRRRASRTSRSGSPPPACFRPLRTLARSALVPTVDLHPQERMPLERWPDLTGGRPALAIHRPRSSLWLPDQRRPGRPAVSVSDPERETGQCVAPRVHLTQVEPLHDDHPVRQEHLVDGVAGGPPLFDREEVHA